MIDSPPLPGRESECARVDAFLSDFIATGPHDDQLAPRLPVLVLEGERGMGKTALLSHVSESAHARGCLVLHAQCTAAESEWSFVVLADLLSGLPTTAFDGLTEQQRAALGPAVTPAFGDGMSTDGTADAQVVRAASEAALHVLSNLAHTRPVVLIVDDLQWIDEASATALRHIVRRSRGAHIALVAAESFTTTGHLTAFSIEGWTRLTLAPLSLGALAEVITRRLDLSLPRRVAVQLLESSGGNPGHALELARATLSRTPGTSTTGSLLSMVAAKLGHVPPRTRDVLLTAALLDSPTAEMICGALGGQDTVWSDLDPAEREGLAAWVGGHVEFTHPLVRSALITGAHADDLRAAHARLALVASDHETRAWHRAHAADGQDETVAAELDEAVRLAAGRGDRHRAAALSELAVDQTPAGSAAMLPRLITSARSLAAAMDLDKALTMVERVVSELPTGPARAGALGYVATLMRALGKPIAAWTAVVDRAIAESNDDPAVLGPLMMQRVLAAMNERRMADAERVIDAAAPVVDAAHDAGLTAQWHSARALLALMYGDDPRVDLERALALGASSGPPELRPHITAVGVLRHRDELAAARVHADAAYRHMLERGVDAELPSLLWNLTELEVWAGNWERAAVLVDRGWETARWSQSGLFQLLHLLSAATVHAHQGKLDLAFAEATRAHGLALECGYPLFQTRTATMLGFIELSRDRPEAVDAILGDLITHAAANTMGEPGLWRMLPDEVEALVRLGRLEEARALLRPFASRAVEIDRKWAIAASLRCRALIEVTAGHDHTDELRTAIDILSDLEMPFERGRCLLVAAEVSRRLRRRGQARDFALEAIEIFAALGADVWRDRAQQELSRVGGRSLTQDGLSVVESQIAKLVAEGLSNREIAASAFMAVRTVEAHLTTIYRKLGVRSRTQLAAALDESPNDQVGA